MLPRRVMGIAVLAFLAFSFAFGQIPKVTNAKVNPPKTLAQALKAGKPTLSLFVKSKACACTAKKCAGACAAVDSIIASINENVSYIKVDIDTESDLARNYKIVAAPIMIIFDAKGNEFMRLQSWEISGQSIKSAIAKMQNPKKTQENSDD